MNDRNLTRTAAALAFALTISGHVRAQTTAAPDTGTPAPTPTAAPVAEEEEDETIVLTPFEVTASTANSYTEANTLAGTRISTEMRDLGNAVSVINSQFLKDTGATNNETVLQYAVGAEVGNVYGNFVGAGDGANLDESSRFSNPNSNTRIRGLAEADNSRDYYLSDVPWDGSTIDRVDLQRGPNATLFGVGSPAGVINSGTKQAQNRNFGSVQVNVGSWGTVRGVLDINREILEDELAVRFIALNEDEKFKQDPAYEKDRRYFGAVRYEPEFLKFGSARTVIKAMIETGEIDSNRPRNLPPNDMITPWFNTGTYGGNWVRDESVTDGPFPGWRATRQYNGTNRGTYSPVQLQANNTGYDNQGQANRNSPNYDPAIGNFAQQFGGPMVYVDAEMPGVPSLYRVWEPTATRGIDSNGVIDRGVGGIPYQRPGSIAPTSSWAKNAQLPFYNEGVWKDNSLTDPSVFDFYNKLIDGPNKWEWQDFNVYNLSVAQTFFNDKMGIEAGYNRETYRRGQISLLSGNRQSIYVDMNSVYADGTPNLTNGVPFGDATPNPNVGRAFVSDSGQFGNNSYLSDKQDVRFTGFAIHDFARNSDNWALKLLGKHTLTGLWSTSVNETDQRNWQRYGTGPEWETFNRGNNVIKFTDNVLTPNTVIYLGDSMLNTSTAKGLNLSNPKHRYAVTSGQVRAFDSSWQGGAISPSALWNNFYYAPENGSHASVQADNPANYVGFVNMPIQIMDSEGSQANRDWLTTSALLQKSDLTSKALVWQGKFWNNALVATASWRNDVAYGYSTSQTVDGMLNSDTNPSGRLNLSPDVYRLPPKSVRAQPRGSDRFLQSVGKLPAGRAACGPLRESAPAALRRNGRLRFPARDQGPQVLHEAHEVRDRGEGRDQPGSRWLVVPGRLTGVGGQLGQSV